MAEGPEDLATQTADDAAASGLDEEESALGHRVSELFPKCVLHLCRRTVCACVGHWSCGALFSLQCMHRKLVTQHSSLAFLHRKPPICNRLSAALISRCVRRNLVSLFSATPEFLKWRDKGFGARPLAVAGTSGAGALDLERMQVRQALPRSKLPLIFWCG